MVMPRRASVAFAVALLSLAPAGPSILFDSATRLLVVAPHPDDEVIAAGGTIRRVAAAGGALRVVYLTDGEASTAGVQATEGRNDMPRPGDYRDYGQRRKREARRALGTLGVKNDAAPIFLGFPNNGLSRLMTRYWSDKR